MVVIDLDLLDLMFMWFGLRVVVLLLEIIVGVLFGIGIVRADYLYLYTCRSCFVYFDFRYFRVCVVSCLLFRLVTLFSGGLLVLLCGGLW